MALLREQVWQSARLLRRHKRFTALAIVSLGVAIALNTTMYSVVDALIRPKLAIPEPYSLYEALYFGDYRRRVPIRERNEALTALTFHVGAAGRQPAGSHNVIEHGSHVRDARVANVTANYFAVLGVRASAGRLLSDIDVASAPTTVVLSERMWRRLFPGRGRFDTATVLLDGEPRTVVGLLPFEADFPGAYTDVWQIPSSAALADLPLTLFRVRRGFRVQAVAELNTLNQRIMERSGDRLPHAGFRFRPSIRPKFQEWGFHMAIVGAVGAVLLIACANLANLQLARGVARARELATRSAVGASRSAIITQLVIESAWLALGGLVLGALLTIWGMRIVETSVPDTLAQYVTRPQTSWRVAVFAMAATSFCVLTVGLLPAIRLSRVDIDTLLKSGAGTGQGKRARRQYAYLVVTEIALALALLCGAGLLMQAALSLYRFELPDNYRKLALTFVRVDPSRATVVRSQRDWSEQVIQTLMRDTTVVSAATERVAAPTRHAVSVDDPGGAPRVYAAHRWGYKLASSELLRTLGVPIIEGRDFSPGEFAEPQVIVDKATATHLWPGVSPVGRLIKLDSPRVDAPWLRIIGVSADLPNPWEISGGQRDDPRPKLGNVWVLNAHDTAQVLPYSSGRKVGGTAFQVLTRTRGDVRRLPVAIRRSLKTGSPAVAGFFVSSYEDLSGIRVRRERHNFMATLFGVFAFCALCLAALGVYAIVSHSIAQRTREFGVRLSLGATARGIRELVFRDANLLALLGIALGLLVTARTAGMLRAFLFSDYDHHDSRIFAVAVVVLFATAWVASWIPARRAMRISPLEALRHD